MPGFAQKQKSPEGSPLITPARQNRANPHLAPEAHPLLGQQQDIGNQAVQRLLKSGAIQPKLKISQPDDKYEKEADSIAEQVIRMPDPRIQCQIELEEEEKEEPIQARSNIFDTATTTPGIESRINSLKGGGQKLSESTRSFFEPKFGASFTQVNVHNNSQAANIAKLINARAFTAGKDVVFGPGQYSPETASGKRLLAHELVHVLQQSRSGSSVQRYTSYSSSDQSAGNSLGWKHPGSEDIRISDDGLMAVEEKGWGPGSNKRAWTTKAKITTSNAKLKTAGSNAKLVEKTNKISGKPPNNSKAKDRELVEIEPQKASGIGTFTLISDCGSACRQVMGSGGGKDVAVMERKGVERYTTPRSYHGGNPTTPEEFFEEILVKEFGTGFTRTELYNKYSNLSVTKKDAFDRKYGINKYAVPEVGQGQTISTEKDMPGFVTTSPMTWNFHYAATVLRSGADHVTLESAAGWGPTDWIFYMYGPAKKAQSFHEEHGAMGSHGTHFTTMVVQSEKRLKGKTNTPGVHLVRDPSKWDTTLIVKLPNATGVYTLTKARNWRKVKVETGPHSGKIGWILDKFFSE